MTTLETRQSPQIDRTEQSGVLAGNLVFRRVLNGKEEVNFGPRVDCSVRLSAHEAELAFLGLEHHLEDGSPCPIHSEKVTVDPPERVDATPRLSTLQKLSSLLHFSRLTLM